ncbi:hypothetical protein [Hyphomicrobium facile]|nr:hypothetical protein [Hyphomicrobium facile]
MRRLGWPDKREKIPTGLSGVMDECNSKIVLSEAYSERLSDDEIAEMMAEAAMVDLLFQSGRISTLYLTGLAAAADASSEWQPEPAASAA